MSLGGGLESTFVLKFFERFVMKLTPFSKVFITVVVLSVVGVTGWHYFGDRIKCWSSPDKCGGQAGPAGSSSSGAVGVSKDDFDGLKGAPTDPARNAVSTVDGAPVTGGKLSRPLRVGINTWAGHAPGVVANLGLPGGKANSIYKEKYGLDVEFKLIDDPAAKFAAFQAGQIDIMWDTVDSWAREASVLAEQGKTRGRAVIMEDWSRGGDGIASLATIKSVEDLAGKKIATKK